MTDHPLTAEGDTGGTAQQRAELPMQGTALNPVESAWVFHNRPASVPPEDLASAMPQGE